MSNHITEQLNAYMDGELKGKQFHQVEEHLAECEVCQAELESLQGLSALLQEVPAAEFISHERFVTQVNLLLPKRQTATARNKILEVSWWMIPVGLLAAWIFLSTSSLISNAVSAADNFGIVDSTTVFISDPSENAAWTARLGQVGVLKGESLQWAETTENLTRNVLPQFIWQVSIALLYLAWIAMWWARQTLQGQGQPLES
ncbi:MAG TPA: zf-HC2 domain-containing protein [Anaerolineales bacterium]|nr:zf-HC2 domain-containing protein [Anaerolineales bacterium]